MSIHLDYIPYKCEMGLVHAVAGERCGNAPRYTGEYVQALINQQLLSNSEKRKLRIALMDLQSPNGNLWRYPAYDHQQSVDDTVATLYWGEQVDAGFAAAWLARGRYKAPRVLGNSGEALEYKPIYQKLLWPIMRLTGLNRFCYTTPDIDKFTLKGWIGRQQQIVAHAQIIAGERVPAWRMAWWIATILIACKAQRHEQDSWVLTWYLVKAARNYKNFVVQWARKKWIAKFKQVWPEGLGQVIADNMGPNHPNGKWLRGEFGE